MRTLIFALSPFRLKLCSNRLNLPDSENEMTYEIRQVEGVYQGKLLAAALDERDPIEWRERTEGISYSAKQVAPLQATKRKEPALSILRCFTQIGQNEPKKGPTRC